MQKLLQKIRKVCDKFIKLERIICCVLLVAILAVCFWSVVMRYCFNSPLSWSEEVIIVLLVWFGFLCMSVETYKDADLAQRIAKEHREAQQKLDELYEDWEELSEAVAEL